MIVKIDQKKHQTQTQSVKRKGKEKRESNDTDNQCL